MPSARFLKSRLLECLLLAFFIGVLLVARAAAQEAAAQDRSAAEQQAVAEPAEDFDFFSDEPVQATAIVELPPPTPLWLRVGGPLALLLFFFSLLGVIWWLVPFSEHGLDLNLRDLPPAAKRGIAMAVVMFGIAFCFGASEIWYMLGVYGSAEAYFAQMSLGKLIAFTHAHLFGFTTSFFIVGIPFSLHFNQLRLYQWVFPAGLAASLTDILSWWGIKYLAVEFEWVSMFCGIVFSVSYMWMLIGLLRVLLFPDVIWQSDKDRDIRLQQQRELEEATRHREGDY
jgi:hypothetical protein